MIKAYSKILFFISLLISVFNLKSQTFSIGSPSSNYSLSCINTAITMTANSGITPYSYTWTVPGSTINGIYANVTLPGTWTVIGQNLTTSVVTQQTFAIGQNLQAPTVAISPTVMNISCNVAPNTFTGTSNLGPNVTTNWYQTVLTNTIYVGSPQGTVNILQPSQPGIYWFVSTNNVTGCSATKSVQVTGSIGVPSFTVTSPTNFTLGCASTSVASMQVSLVNTTPVPNVPVSYTFIPPTSTVIITPTTVLGPNPNQINITTPGTWTVYVKDLTNNCLTSMPVSIISNTVSPNIYHIQPLPILNCYNPSMALTGVSDNTNTTVTWTVPSLPSNTVNPTPTHTVTTSTAIAGSTNNITYLGTYSVGAIDNNNQCKNSYTLQLLQDIRIPNFSISALTNSIINCINQDVTLVPIITPTLAVALIPTYTWYPPVSGFFAGTQFTTTSGGTHTAVSISATNGCTTMATYVVVADNQVGATGGNVGVTCPVTTVAISPTITTNPSSITFSWSGVPGTITSAINQSSITVNSLGTYTCVITNTVNGCADTIYCTAVCNTGLINYSTSSGISVFPNPSNGLINVEQLNAGQKMKFIVYDLQGKILLERILNSKSNKIETNLPKGLYLYCIIKENIILRKDKLIID